MLNIATRAARAAATVILQSVDRIDRVKVGEKAYNDFVTDIDQKAEAEIIDTLKTAYPDHVILAEESAPELGEFEQHEAVWIIDPLDGTTNFIHGFPHFAISIALMQAGKLTLGLIYDPLREEMFTAERGKGALLNGRRIRVSDRPSLKGALLGTGFPFRNPSNLAPHLTVLTQLFEQVAGVRRAGSAALDLAYIAAGRLDGFWEADLQPWDIAAGLIIIKEAGGLVSDYRGQETSLNSGQVVTGNPRILQAMLGAIRTASN